MGIIKTNEGAVLEVFCNYKQYDHSSITLMELSVRRPLLNNFPVSFEWQSSQALKHVGFCHGC